LPTSQALLPGRRTPPIVPGSYKEAPRALFRHRHLLGIEGVSPEETNHVLDLADGCVELSRQAEKKPSLLWGRTIIDRFFESSMRTRTAFDVTGKLGKGEEAASG
jgi:aspartate carbamoyltransferase catalytic subunit